MAALRQLFFGASVYPTMVEQGEIDGYSTPLVSVVTSGVTLVTLTLAFGLLAVGWPYFWVIFIIGFGGVLPFVATLAAWYDSRPEETEQSEQSDIDGELATVREQYANGEIDDATFERRIERLLETESIEDAERFYGGADESEEREARDEEFA